MLQLIPLLNLDLCLWALYPERVHVEYSKMQTCGDVSMVTGQE